MRAKRILLLYVFLCSFKLFTYHKILHLTYVNFFCVNLLLVAQRLTQNLRKCTDVAGSLLEAFSRSQNVLKTEANAALESVMGEILEIVNKFIDKTNFESNKSTHRKY